MVSSLFQSVMSAIDSAKLTSADRLVVGLSGGVDSLALTHLLLHLERAGYGPRVYPVHVDHRLRSDSAEAARSVARAGIRMGREVEIIVVDVEAWNAVLRQGTESAARAARYAALAAAALKLETSWIAVAHNADDQAETVLLALFRGASSGALAGMRQCTTRAIPLDPVGNVRTTVSLMRPLLNVRRSEIESFVKSAKLEPIEDPSNHSLRFQRNVVRHNVLPRFEEAVPGAVDAIVRSAEFVRRDDEFLRSLATKAVHDLSQSLGTEVHLIRRDLFRGLAEPIQRRVLWELLDQLKGSERRIKQERIEAARVSIAGPGEGRAIEIVDDLLIYLDYERAAISHRETLFQVLRHESDFPLFPPWQAFNLAEGSSVARLAGGWELKFEVERVDREPTEHPKLRTRRAGDRIVPGNRRTLQDLMVDRKVPRYVRDWLPIIAFGSSVIWVGGLSPSQYGTDDGALAITLERKLPAREEE